MSTETTCMHEKDIQIHIHEHVGPLRERVGKIEGKMEVHDRELTMLRQGIDGLRDRIDGTREAMLNALNEHTADEIKRFEDISATGATLKERIEGLQNRMVALFIGAGAVFAIFEMLQKFGIVHGVGQ
jgi:hypothetical protein